MLRNPKLTFIWIAFAAVTVACAGRGVHRLDPNAALPQDVPKDFVDKFAVSDVAPNAPVPGPSPSATPLSASLSSKKKKKKQTPAFTADKASAQSPAPLASPSPTGLYALPNRRPPKEPIWLGEKLTYEITYFGMAAGDFTLEVKPYKYVAGRKAYHIEGLATSSRVFSLFYRLNDTVETLFDFDGLFSHKFHIVLDETKQTRDSLELNDSEKGQSYYWNRWNPKDQGPKETKGFFPMEPLSQDSLSAIYYMRCLPWADGKTFEFPVMNEGKNWTASLSVIRHENLDTPVGHVRTIVVKPETKFHGIAEKRGDSFVWITEDDRKFVVRIEAKVKIGTVVARLKKVELGTPPTQ